jgi:ATP-dependent RNA helicase DDX46/PRP5
MSLVEHHTVKYAPFRKDFYVESPEIGRMTEEEVASYRNELDGIKIRGKDCPRPIRKWTQCGLDQRVTEVIQRCKYVKPTPIQAQAIPAIMSGRDMIGIAKTGSGKTIAFVLPMLRHVLDQPKPSRNEGPIALIMTPTRELAMQTYSECQKFAKVLNLKVVCAYGGAPIKDQIADLKRGAEIVICTPGRFIDLLVANSGKVTNLKRVSYLVLDEADRMFDMGFGPQVLKIVANIRPDKQAVLFSATFPQTMEALARKILIRPLEIVVGTRSTVSGDVEQLVDVVDEDRKFWKLLEVLGRWYETKSNRILIFVDRQDSSDSLLKDLIRRGYHCNSLHGGKDQADRDCAIADFKQGNIPILVATSVAARGLDVRDLKLVINYECPNHMEDYVHRVGRTGRAGNKGTAITFITPEQERYAPEIVKALKASKAHIPANLQRLADTYMEKLRSGQVQMVGSGFGGKGLDRIDEEHERMKRAQKLLMGGEDALSSDEEEEALAAASGVDRKKPKLVESKQEQKPKSAGAPDLATLARQISAKVGGEEEAVDPLAALNARYKSATSTSGEVMAIYDRPAVPGGAPIPRSFFAEFDVNDYPPAARFKITHKETLTTIMEFCGAQMFPKGEFIPAGRLPKDGQRRLFIRIDAESEVAVEKALKELRRVLFEAITEGAERGTLEASRYGL